MMKKTKNFFELNAPERAHNGAEESVVSEIILVLVDSSSSLYISTIVLYFSSCMFHGSLSLTTDGTIHQFAISVEFFTILYIICHGKHQFLV